MPVITRSQAAAAANANKPAELSSDHKRIVDDIKIYLDIIGKSDDKKPILAQLFDYILRNAVDFVNENQQFKEVLIKKATEFKTYCLINGDKTLLKASSKILNTFT